MLWRITGKGLPQASYLFGTMHLSDKRLFRFDDSVYHAIEKTEGLAIELNPDELVAYYINNMLDQGDSKTLKELLGETDYERYRIRLSKKFNKPADKVTQRDIVKEKNRWLSDYMSRGQMPTFVDAYLYNIARRQNKWIGGIEDLSDQLGVYPERVNKSDIDLVTATRETDPNNNVEQLIKLYLAQDLGAIDKLMSASSHIDKDLLITRRNIKMAARMDSLSARRSMFFAVGAAHLPGDSGVIALLRSRGFTVSPVWSKKKIAADRYSFPEVPIAWKDIKDEQGLYSVKMPGTPVHLKMHGLIDTKVLFDIFTMTSYSIMSVLSSKDSKALEDRYANATINASNTKNTKPKDVYAGNIPGREYINSGTATYIRTRVFSEGNLTYFVMVSGGKKANVMSADANKFFDSFRVRSDHKSKPRIAPGILFTEPNMAVRLQTTAPLSLSKSLCSMDSAAGLKVTTYTGTDVRNKAYILLICKEAMQGFSFSNARETNAVTLANIEKQYNVVDSATKVAGYDALWIEGFQGASKLRAMSYVRGNKNIVLMVIADTSNGRMPEIERMFTSIQPIPYAPLIFTNKTSPNGDFSTSAPKAFIVSHATNLPTGLANNHVETFDSTTSTTYIVLTDTLNKYYWATTDSAFWNSGLEHHYEPETDAIVTTRKTLNGRDPGREWIIRKGQSGTYKRVRIIQHGAINYTLITSSALQIVTSERTEKFLADFRINTPTQTYSWKTPKTSLLIKDLASKDSAARNNAYTALNRTMFTKRDLPQLHKAVFRHYLSTWGNDTTIQINNLLGRKLAEIANGSTISIIKTNYALLTGHDVKKRGVALGVLARMKTNESYRTIFSLLEKYNLPASEQYQVNYLLKDSLALLQNYSAHLLPMLKDTSLGLLAADWTNKLLDSNYLSMKDVLPYENDLLKTSSYKLNLLQKDTNGNAYQLQPIVELLARFTDAPALGMLKKYLAVEDLQMRMKVILTLLKKGYEPDSNLLKKLSGDSTLCLEFYDALQLIDKTRVFPASHCNQRHFAAAIMYRAAIANEVPSRFKFIKMTTAIYNQKKYKFYLFRLTFGEGPDAKRWLGISGAYDLAGKQLKPGKNDLAGIYDGEAYNKLKIDEQLAHYLSEYETRAIDPPTIGYNNDKGTK